MDALCGICNTRSGNSYSIPAVGAFLTQIVPEDKLTMINAMQKPKESKQQAISAICMQVNLHQRSCVYQEFLPILPSAVLLQEKVEGDFLGRVFGILGMISSTMMPLGMLLFGPLADIIKIEWLLLATGLLLFIQGFFLLGNKVLIEAGMPAEGESSV